MIPFALTLVALAAPGAASTAADAVAAALAVRGARVELEDTRVPVGVACLASVFEALQPVTSSGEVPLRLRGADRDGRTCQAFGWARVRVFSPGLVTSRTVLTGEPLEGAVTTSEVELRPGHTIPLATLPSHARAAHTIPAGAPVLNGDIRTGPLPGEPITVVVRIAGGLEIAQEGRALPCSHDRACALLPGGKRVEGPFEDGQLLLESP